jgi:hypothetical protein
MPVRKEYKPMRRRARTIPFGYYVSEDDPQLLIPDLRLLALLEAAERAWLQETSTQADIAAWLAAKSGVPISRLGLKKRLFDTEKKIRKRERNATDASKPF